MTDVDQPTGNRISKTVTAPSTTIKDVYALGHLSEQTDSAGNPLATFTYENSGRPASVVLGNPATGNRYYYVYNGHGDVVALTDSSGTPKASYTYDAFGILLSSSETLEGWSNPYRYDGADLVRYDSETGLYWMSVRAYDPTLGRFISHDPLGRLAAQGIDLHPYVYTGNNPVNRIDPSGQRYIQPFGNDEDQSSPPPPPPPTWLEAAQALARQLRQAKTSKSHPPSDHDIASQLGKAVEGDRHDRGLFPSPQKPYGSLNGTNAAAGVWYITGSDGILLDFGNLADNKGSKVAYSRGGIKNHSEKLLLDPVMNGGYQSLFSKMDTEGGEALHFVIFTQLEPCSNRDNSCQSYFSGFLSDMKQKLINFAKAEDTTPSPLWWEDEDFSVSLSVWATGNQDAYYSSGHASVGSADNLNLDIVDGVGVTNYFNESTGSFED